jgi:hypothetical protein
MSLIRKLNDHYLANISKPAEILHPELQDIVKIHALDNRVSLDPVKEVKKHISFFEAAHKLHNGAKA